MFKNDLKLDQLASNFDLVSWSTVIARSRVGRLTLQRNYGKSKTAKIVLFFWDTCSRARCTTRTIPINHYNHLYPVLLAGSGYTIENIKAIIKPGFFKQILQSLNRGNSAFG